MLHAQTLPVWSRIGPDVGRQDLDEATAAVMRRALAGSAAPGLVAQQARDELDTAGRLLAESVGLAPAVPVLARAVSTVGRSLDAATAYVASASPAPDERSRRSPRVHG